MKKREPLQMDDYGVEDCDDNHVEPEKTEDDETTDG